MAVARLTIRAFPSELIRPGHSGHISLITSSHRSRRSRNFLGLAYSRLQLIQAIEEELHAMLIRETEFTE
jgi:hypothetical protein